MADILVAAAYRSSVRDHLRDWLKLQPLESGYWPSERDGPQGAGIFTRVPGPLLPVLRLHRIPFAVVPDDAGQESS